MSNLVQVALAENVADAEELQEILRQAGFRSLLDEPADART